MCNWTQFENICHLFFGLISIWIRRYWTSKATERHKDPSLGALEGPTGAESLPFAS